MDWYERRKNLVLGATLFHELTDRLDWWSPLSPTGLGAPSDHRSLAGVTVSLRSGVDHAGHAPVFGGSPHFLLFLLTEHHVLV